jgi:hypothetical protein
MVFMQSLTHNMQIKDIHYLFGGNVYQSEKYQDGDIITQEFQVRFHSRWS